ncbi:MAG: signal peptidase I [Candidatus Roizmanbacteria bacterium]|nr:signal peptidase I [Candidatus Roizmanbacteria bacterium]
MPKLLSFIDSPYYYFVVLLFIVFCFSLFIFSRELPGGLRIMTAKSDSMIPAITKGDLMVVKDEYNWYEKGDIVTFYAQKPDGTEEIVTHRIYSVSGNVYITKGDHNEAIDEQKLRPRLIIGKVITVIRSVGHIVVFLKSPMGQLLSIVFPGLFFSSIEVLRIIAYFRQRTKDYTIEITDYD